MNIHKVTMQIRKDMSKIWRKSWSERIKLKKIDEGEAIEVKEFRKVYDV